MGAGIAQRFVNLSNASKYVAHLKDTMEHGFRPLKAGKMYPNALKTLPSGAARQGGLCAASTKY